MTGLKPLLRTLAPVLSLGIAPAAAGAQQSPPAAPAALVLDGVTVVDVASGARLPGRRIVIVGNRVTALGRVDSLAIPKDARVVDGRGTYVIPGLWDMHVHLHPRGDSAADAEANIERWYVAAGVTGVRDAGSPIPLGELLRRRRDILAGVRVGPPRQILSGQAINEAAPPDKCTRGNHTFDACALDTADARHLVDSLAAAGVDMIKLHDVSRTMYAAIAAEAHRLGLPFGGHAQGGRAPVWKDIMRGAAHVDDGISASDAASLGARIVDHQWGDPDCQVLAARKWDARLKGKGVGSPQLMLSLKRIMHSGYRPERFARCLRDARRFRRADTWFVPTLVEEVPFRGAAADAVVARYNARVRAWETADTSARERSALHGNWLRDSIGTASPQATTAEPLDSVMSFAERVGLPILAGTDEASVGVPSAFMIHAEVAAMVAEGLSPLHALQSATLNPAKMLHATDSLGTVAPGKLADLVLLDGDPLQDITNTTAIRAVVANGRYFDRAALDALLGAQP